MAIVRKKMKAKPGKRTKSRDTGMAKINKYLKGVNLPKKITKSKMVNIVKKMDKPRSKSSKRIKYDTNRPSPPYSATQFDTGYVGCGNDGDKWIVKSTSKGVRRWVKFEKTDHESHMTPKKTKSKRKSPATKSKRKSPIKKKPKRKSPATKSKRKSPATKSKRKSPVKKKSKSSSAKKSKGKSYSRC